jgi:hypothetical protein
VADREHRLALEDGLGALARELNAQLGEHDLVRAVLDRIERTPMRVRPRRSRRRVAAIVAAAVAAVALTASAAVAIRNYFDVGAIRVHENVGTREPIDPDAQLDLGTPMSLRAARERAAVAVPTADGFASPDEVWFADARGGVVSLVYRVGPGISAAEHTDGVGLLIQEVTGDGRQTFAKHLSAGTRAVSVTVGDEPGVFLTGADHSLYYVDPSGTERSETGRLVGRALIFQRGSRTIRLEGALSLDRLLAIAVSMR